MSIQVLWVQFCSKENHQNESVSNRKWSDPTFSFGRTKSWPDTPTSPQHSQNSKDGEASHLTGLTWDFENGSDAGHEGQASSMLTIPWEFSWTGRAPSTIFIPHLRFPLWSTDKVFITLQPNLHCHKPPISSVPMCFPPDLSTHGIMSTQQADNTGHPWGPRKGGAIPSLQITLSQIWILHCKSKVCYVYVYIYIMSFFKTRSIKAVQACILQVVRSHQNKSFLRQRSVLVTWMTFQTCSGGWEIYKVFMYNTHVYLYIWICYLFLGIHMSCIYHFVWFKAAARKIWEFGRDP